MKESKVLRRNVYIVFLPLGIIISTGLTINAINNICVLKTGKPIEATLIKKEYEGTSQARATFSHDGETFRVSEQQVGRIDTFKIGAISNFFHLNTQPDRYVWTKKDINDFYFNLVLYVVVFIISVGGLFNTIKNWNNKERWVRD